MNNVILSAKHPIFAAKLQQLGYHVIHSESVGCFIPYEQDHADMQCLILDQTAFVLDCCHRLKQALSEYYQVVSCSEGISGAYPHNVALNALLLGKRVIARVDSLDEKIKRYCAENRYELIHVKQGYTKCSCAVVNDHAIITADKGVYRSLKELNIDILLIEEGRVKLDGAPCGFIGGATGLDHSPDKRTLYFSGNIQLHPDGERIERFCEQHGTEAISLSEDEVRDIGGIIFC